MNENRVEELLLKLLEDMAVVKSRLDSIEEIKLDAKELANKVDMIESTQSTHHKQITSLEKRQSALEEFIRSEMSDSNKQHKTTTVSVGIAILTAVLSLIITLF